MVEGRFSEAGRVSKKPIQPATREGGRSTKHAVRVEKHRNQCHNQEAMGTSENKKKIIQGAIPNKFSTAEAAFQPVENNDYYKLELSGAWESMRIKFCSL